MDTAGLHVIKGALDPLPVGVVLFRPDGHVLVSNRAARDILGSVAGRPLQEWPGTKRLSKPGGEVVGDGDLPPALTLQDGLPRKEVELCVLDGYGRAVPVLASSRAVSGPSGEVAQVALTLTPIPGQCKRREQDQHDQRLRAIAALTSGVAGPLNDALTAISGYCDLALERIEDADPIQGVVAEIRQAGERAGVLVGRLLSHARTEVPTPRAFEIDRWLAVRVTSLRALLGDDIVLELAPEARGARVEADPRLLQQILADLLANARDAMPEGGRLRIATSIMEDLDGGDETSSWIVLTVQDSGGGVSEQTLRRLFEPFFTTKANALGLGLTTVDRIVRAQGGHIRVENRRGEGVAFHVHLPRAEAPADDAQEERRDDARRTTVLVVEDDVVVRELVHQVLEMDHYRVLEARSGADADRLLDSWTGPAPDLLVCDLVLPGENGGTTAMRLKDRLPGLRILLMSGACHPGQLPEQLTEHQAAFLPKPFSPKALRTRIRDLQREGREEEPLPSADLTLRPSA